MVDDKLPTCGCGHDMSHHVGNGTGECIYDMADDLDVSDICTCTGFKDEDELVITYCKGTKRKHRLLYFETEANPTSGILTIWYICSHCNHCIVRHYNPKNANCTIVTDEEVDLQDDKGNSI